MEPSKISVFIVDDHLLMRQALQASILTEDGMEVVGVAVNGEEAVRMIPTLQPNVVIMDLVMPNMNGLDATHILTQTCPQTYILIFSSLEKEKTVSKAMRAGARGYLTKNVQHDELINAIRVVSTGQSYLLSDITEN